MLCWQGPEESGFTEVKRKMAIKIVILGSTGSIGRNTLEVIEGLGDRFEVKGLSTNRNLDEFQRQCEQICPSVVAVGDEAVFCKLAGKSKPSYIEKVLHGPEGLVALATMPDIDIVVNALVGGVGLMPTIKALEAGKRVALANKESLVMAGDIVLETARNCGGEIIPVDSEHSAVFQMLEGKPKNSIRRVVLTASGGPFRQSSLEKLAKVTVEDALNHPTWEMGRKITVDSATLANKGLEVIEAHHLFGLDYDRIKVLVHPQSIVHSMVEFVDDSLVAHLSKPDMKIPIQYALTYPERLSRNGYESGGLELSSLTFEEVRSDIFPTLGYAYEAGRKGGTAPAAYNAVNEVAVEKFLRREIPFNEIPVMVKWALQNHPYVEDPDLDQILAVDRWTRENTTHMMSGKQYEVNHEKGLN